MIAYIKKQDGTYLKCLVRRMKNGVCICLAKGKGKYKQGDLILQSESEYLSTEPCKMQELENGKTLYL